VEDLSLMSSGVAVPMRIKIEGLTLPCVLVHMDSYSHLRSHGWKSFVVNTSEEQSCGITLMNF